MDRRHDLQIKLEGILGSRNVYFQPPPSVQISYPAIVYERETFDIKHADNFDYRNQDKYQITVMDRNPVSQIPRKVAGLSLASHNTRFVKDGLYHDIFTLYF